MTSADRNAVEPRLATTAGALADSSAPTVARHSLRGFRTARVPNGHLRRSSQRSRPAVTRGGVMRIIDPVVLAEAAQGALDRLGELTARRVRGRLVCTQPATPDGPARFIDRDDRGSEVWMRRWRCVAGQWYHSKRWHPTGRSDAHATHPDRAAEGAERAPVRVAFARST